MRKLINTNVLSVFFILSLFSLSFSQTNEQITLTTYYPSPYGSYVELRSRRMALGNSYMPATYCWAPAACANIINANTDLVVEGNVGIGTINPTVPLQIVSPTAGIDFLIQAPAGSANRNANMALQPLDPVGEASYYFYDSAGTWQSYMHLHPNDPTNALQFSTFGLRDITFGTNATARMRITATGDVGIGTASPGYILDVQDPISKVNSLQGYLTNGADYAEYFENEETISRGALVGINLNTGKVRKYREADEFLGIVSDGKGFIGNGNSAIESDPNYTLVGLLGQLKFNQDEVLIEKRIVYTKDKEKKKIGVLLNSGKLILLR